MLRASLHIQDPSAAAAQPRDDAGWREPLGHCQTRRERGSGYVLQIKADFSQEVFSKLGGQQKGIVT